MRSVAIDGDRMAVTLDATPNEIVIMDSRRGEKVGRIRLKSGGARPGSVAGSP